MSGQEDLKNWLNQLKKRSGGASGSGQARPSQPRPVHRPAPSREAHIPQSDEVRRASQNFDPDLVDVGRGESVIEKSATDIALERLRQEEQALRLQKKREALAKRRRAEENFQKQQQELKAAENAVRKVSSRKTPKSENKEIQVFEESCSKELPVDISRIHYKLRNNPSAMKEALILSEIILPPVSMRDKHLDHS